MENGTLPLIRDPRCLGGAKQAPHHRRLWLVCRDRERTGEAKTSSVPSSLDLTKKIVVASSNAGFLSRGAPRADISLKSCRELADYKGWYVLVHDFFNVAFFLPESEG